MIIRSASYVKSSPALRQCPSSGLPEFAFTGRSNVGKSSLLNLLAGHSGLAKISSNPGKTRTINHFIINDEWYLVDLPGYGYARVPAKMREKWQKAAREYILGRENLVCLFVLIDSRLDPQKADLEFMEFLGLKGVPFARVFTKTDKVGEAVLRKSLRIYDDAMFQRWEYLPITFLTSARGKKGRDEILGFIEESINKFSNSN